jgi:alkylhydroperoxidase/carboxymuconolactone decarboxylase family protein YurZ
LDLGFPPEQIVEIPIQLLFYTGAPIANTALRVCYDVFQRRGLTLDPTRHHDTSMDSEELYRRGVAQRQSIMGDHIAGGLEESSDPVDQDWSRYLTEYLWGAVWTRPLLDVKQRMICTLSDLSEVGDEQALRNYIRVAIRIELSQDEVKELFYHLTLYIGVPHARRGKALANDVLSSL